MLVSFVWKSCSKITIRCFCSLQEIRLYVDFWSTKCENQDHYWNITVKLLQAWVVTPNKRTYFEVYGKDCFFVLSGVLSLFLCAYSHYQLQHCFLERLQTSACSHSKDGSRNLLYDVHYYRFIFLHQSICWCCIW